MAESPQLKRQVWEFLNDIGSKEMLNEGRVYGGGLHKLEPREFGRVPAVAGLANLGKRGYLMPRLCRRCPTGRSLKRGYCWTKHDCDHRPIKGGIG